jgi:hypothetical protein
MNLQVILNLAVAAIVLAFLVVQQKRHADWVWYLAPGCRRCTAPVAKWSR